MNTNKIVIKKITIENYNKNDIINLLSQLTICPNLDQEKYNNIINNLPHNHNSFVVDYNNIPIGIGTIIIEQKLIHDGKCVAHIEDIVVDKNYRNNKIGNILLTFLINEAKQSNCYKIILNCNDNTKNFYEKNNFKKTNYQMTMYL